MADELDRILNDLSDELKGLSRVLQSTFKIFDKGNMGEAQHQKQINNQRKIVLDLLKEEGKISDKDYKSTVKGMKATQKNTGAIGKATTSVTDFGDAIGLATKGGLKELAKASVGTIKTFAQADKKVDGFGDALKSFDGNKLLGAGLDDIGRVLDFNVGIFKTLSQQGAGFGKSMFNMKEAATAANMPLLDFVDLIQQNSNTFAKMFGSVMDGIPTIQTFHRVLRDRTKNELAEFGLNLEETSEFLTTQLEIERATGNSDRIRNKDMVSQTVEYAKVLTRLSKLTGLSVKDLDKKNRAAALDGAFQASLVGMGKKQADNARALNTALESTNPAMATMWKEIVQFGVPVSDASKAMSVLSKGALPDLMNDLKNGNISLEDYYSAQRRITNVLNTKDAKALAQAGMLGQTGFIDALNAFATAAGATAHTVQTQMEAVGDNTEKVVAANDTWKIVKTNAEAASAALFRLTANSDTFGAFLNAFNKIDGDINSPKTTNDVTNSIFKGVIENGAMWVKDKAATLKERATDNIGISSLWFKTEEQKKKDAEEKEEWRNGKRQIRGFNNGTDGFVNFGAGTPVTLHGSEAVVPENSLFGHALTELSKIKETGASTGASTINNNIDSVQLATLNSATKELVEINKKVANNLNTLITIGAMTEKNTKTTNKNLADMTGSLV
jgi:hypothetical protein